MRVMRTMNDQIEYQDIQPEHLKQFKRRGWLEAPVETWHKMEPDNPLWNIKVIKPEPEPEPVRIPESEVKPKNKGGRPKKINNGKND